ncbi:MAG TPA: protein-glutamate O-methyltransferase CheR [Candidatus Xenobia bacterium]|jgi:chemotaxis protein methyltransferase CheR
MNQPLLPATLPLTDTVFVLLAELIHQRTGLLFDKDKRELLECKLSSLPLDRNIRDFLEYYYFLKYHEEAEAEWIRVQRALAVNETFFWREPDQLRAVARLAAGVSQPVRIWHAGCCTGEEPYSMEIALRESSARGIPRSIIASDANCDSIAAAERGLYLARSFRQLPPALRDKYFDAQDKGWLLHDDVRSSVSFSCQNLMRTAMGNNAFDFIFCRNVFIYFSRQAVEKTAGAFYQALRPGGYLMLGAAESLLRFDTPFEFTELGGAIAYRKAA